MNTPSSTCNTCGGPHDCDDADPSVNPGATEDGRDAVDDDCDGSQMVRRDHVSGLVSASGSGMVAVHGTWNGDEVLLQPVAGGAATLTWAPGLTWTTGAAWLQVHLNTNDAAPCTVEERLNGATGWTTVGTLAVGDNAVQLGLQPGQVLTAVRVRCLGTGSPSKLDWVVLGNGSTPYPVLTDLDIRYTDMHTPDYGSAPASVRASADGSYLYITTDVGGFAWTDDMATWHMANGDGYDFAYGDQYNLWDVLPVGDTDPPRVYTIMGPPAYRPDPNQGDHHLELGVWYTDDNGVTWNQVFKPLSGPNLDNDFWATRRGNDYGDLSGRGLNGDSDPGMDSYASGHLLLEVPGSDGNILVVDNSLMETLDAGRPDRYRRGVYLLDGVHAAGDSCPVVTVGTGPGEVPPTLRVVATAFAKDTEGDDVLVLGGRVPAERVWTGAPLVWEDEFLNTVYTCTGVPTTCADGPAWCLPVVEPLNAVWSPDVRDIEVNPVSPTVFYVADGGYRTEDGKAYDWDPAVNDTTVWRVEAVAGPLGWAVADTDTTGNSNPVWMDTGEDYADACGSASVSDGNLATPLPGEVRGSIDTIEVSPDGDWLFAGIPMTAAGYGRLYACPRLFRLDISADTDLEGTGGYVADDENPWHPLQDVNAIERSTTADLGGQDDMLDRRWVTFAYPDPSLGEPWTEVAPTAGILDLEFVRPGGATGGEPWQLFVDTVTPYLAQAETIWPGWDTPLSSMEDLDQVPFVAAWTENAGAWQNMGQTDVAWCASCGEGRVEAADGQDGWYSAFPGDETARPPMWRDCHQSTLGDGASDVSAWEDPYLGRYTSSAAPQLWVAGDAADTADDRDGIRYLMFATWDEVEDRWTSDSGAPCLDISTWATGEWANFSQDGALDCGDGLDWDVDGNYDSAGSIDNPWSACADDWGFFDLDRAGVGSIRTIVAIDEDLAVLAAAPVNTQNFPGGEGLWLVRRVGATGMRYQAITYHELDPDQSATTTCPASSFFADNSMGAPEIVVDRARWLATRTQDALSGQWVGELRLFVMGRPQSDGSCGLAEVMVNAEPGDYVPAPIEPFVDNGTSVEASWFELDYYNDTDGTNASTKMNRGCTPSPTALAGISLSADSEWLYFFGGNELGSAGSGLTTATNNTAGVCAVRVGAARDLDLSLNSSGVCDVVYNSPLDPAGFDTTDGTLNMCVPYPAEQAVRRDVMPARVASFVPDPEVQGVFYAGTQAYSGCDFCEESTPPTPPMGVYVAQRRVNATTGEASWAFEWNVGVTDPDDLEFREINQLVPGWGPGVSGDVRHIYVGTTGGGLWDGETTW